MNRPLHKLLLTLGLVILTGFAYAQPIDDSADYIDISISIFEENLPQDKLLQKQLNIYPQVRKAEARYMPALLRAVMQVSDRWGAIRIIPENEASAELMISGVIIKSDGLVLELEIKAVDSTGLIWVNKIYTSTANDSISLNSLNAGNENGIPEHLMDPFQAVYTQIQNDLLAFYQQLSSAELAQIKAMSFLRYGTSLSEQSFASYIQQTPEGRYLYSNLPASNDPMVQRVEEIRQHEYLFVDVVDGQYQDFLVEIKPIYDLWRNYTKELVESSLGYQSRQGGDRQFNRGTYRALRESYDNFRWEKMQAQYLDQLSEGFSNEVLPTAVEMDDQVYELSGTLENQYWEWQEILRELFELENI